jgi:hypothetical protein
LESSLHPKRLRPDQDNKVRGRAWLVRLHQPDVARNHALIDGDKRLALTAIIAFYGLNGRRLTLSNDAVYDLVMAVAAGQPDSVDEIAALTQRGGLQI